jgi:hypothetical protein
MPVIFTTPKLTAHWNDWICLWLPATDRMPVLAAHLDDLTDVRYLAASASARCLPEKRCRYICGVVLLLPSKIFARWETSTFQNS